MGLALAESKRMGDPHARSLALETKWYISLQAAVTQGCAWIDAGRLTTGSIGRSGNSSHDGAAATYRLTTAAFTKCCAVAFLVVQQFLLRRYIVCRPGTAGPTKELTLPHDPCRGFAAC